MKKEEEDDKKKVCGLCGVQKTTFGSQFSPSIVSQKTTLGCQACEANAFTC